MRSRKERRLCTYIIMCLEPIVMNYGGFLCRKCLLTRHAKIKIEKSIYGMWKKVDRGRKSRSGIKKKRKKKERLNGVISRRLLLLCWTERIVFRRLFEAIFVCDISLNFTLLHGNMKKKLANNIPSPFVLFFFLQ